MGLINDITGYFPNVSEDFSNYTWYKGEKENPYIKDTFHPLAASFWEYEREFHYSYLDRADTSKCLAESYSKWKNSFITEYLPGKSPNPYGDTTNWEQIFNTGKR